MPEGVDQLLRSKEAFAATLLAAGWLEAALQLHQLQTIPDAFPDWVAYGLTQALRHNRGNKQALAFAAGQQPSLGLDLLVGELLLADGQVDEGVERLTKLVKDGSDVGFRAVWLLSLAHIERGQFDKAREIVRSHPRFAASVTGREAVARTAVLAGNAPEADRLYTALQKNSVEARAYLARRAFEHKDWAAARRMTEELLQLMPDQLQLRANLDAIAKAEGG